MDATSYLRVAFVLMGATLVVVLVRSWVGLPSLNSEKLELDCSEYGSWCTFKSRFHGKGISSNGEKVLTLLKREQSKRGTIDHEREVPQHPLDPLTIKEVRRVRKILEEASFFSNGRVTIQSLVLEEPIKERVLGWKAGDGVPGRKASVIALVDGRKHKLLVDIASGHIVSDEVSHATGYPTMTIEDMNVATAAPAKDQKVVEIVRRRGVNASDLACVPVSSGWFGPAEEGRRVIKVQCYSMQGTANLYMRPIEGLTIVVDMDSKEIVRIIDEGKKIPLAKAEGTDYRFSAQNLQDLVAPLNPISIEQPKGRSFRVDGHLVRWGSWEMHVKPDPRAGVIISQVKVKDPDTAEMRRVLYKGFTSELFVPYMDPTEGWYFKTYMDAGEYGFGLQAMPLVPLNDCPRNAYYMDGILTSADGTPFVRPNMICIFERYAGDIAWRHSESPITGMEIREARPKVSLVVRMAASVANYDYIVDWEFQTDGLIRITVGLSGLLMVKGTAYTKVDEIRYKEETYGNLVAENLIGVIHDHFVTFYLDMDVDGTRNSFVKMKMVKQHVKGGSTPRKSYWKAEKHVAQTEKDARIKLSLFQPSEFHVLNPFKMSKVGNPAGYKIVPAATAATLLDPEDPPQHRASFTNNQIWITPYNRSEEWAGGLFAYQSHGDDTVAVWSDRDRAIEKKDIVAWYTLGFHHIPCQEDFPIMPMVKASFDLKPSNFFGSNPILRTAPNFEKDLPTCTAVTV